MKDAKMIIRVSEYAKVHDKIIRLEDMVTRLEKENTDLRLQLQQAREHLTNAPLPPILLDGSAIEPDTPTGLPTFWFEINTGPYQADDTAMQRSHPWSRGPFTSWNEANDEWKAYLKRQRENGQP